MALSIPLTSTTNAYTDANAAVFDFGGTPYASGYLYVQNAAANVSIKVGVGQGQTDWGTDFPVSPSLLPFTAGQSSQLRTGQSIFGVRATSLAAGVPAVIYGAFFQGGDASLIPSAQVSGTITTSGTIVTGGTTVAGWVAANGTVLAGQGFTVAHPSTGVYNITFDSPFNSVPVVTVLAGAVESNPGFGQMDYANSTASLAVIHMESTALTVIDGIFGFTAQNPSSTS